MKRFTDAQLPECHVRAATDRSKVAQSVDDDDRPSRGDYRRVREIESPPEDRAGDEERDRQHGSVALPMPQQPASDRLKGQHEEECDEQRYGCGSR